MIDQEVGSVTRVDPATIAVTYFNPPDEGGNRLFQVKAGQTNYDAYLDMVGGSIGVGETKPIRRSIGGVTMTSSGDLVYEIFESQNPLRPGVREIVKKHTQRYFDLLRKYPGLSPGRSRPILPSS